MTFTHEFMQNNCGCYSRMPGKLEQCSFMKNEVITDESIINSEILLNDKFWFFCKKVFKKKQNQQIAIKVAEAVLPIWEKTRPDDMRPREAIEAAKQYIAGHIDIDQLIKKRNVAYTASVYVTSTAASAASYADAATFYADAADIKQQLFDILKLSINGSKS